MPLEIPPPPEVDFGQVDDVLPPDRIRSIDEPKYESVREAETVIDPDERVIGLVINGDARAYPIPILSKHEIVNDTVGGEPVAVTWCPLCSSALVFSRRVDGQTEPLLFGVSGKLLYNTLVMFDRQTGTLWSQLYGTSIDGILRGITLKFFPSELTEWAAWKERHPDSLVLSKRRTCEQFNCGTYGTNPRGSYDDDPYESYYNTPLEGVVDYQIPREATLRSAKLRVLGLRIGGSAKAYPYDVLDDLRLVNDILAGVPVLVWFDPQTQTGLAYGRSVEGRMLVFSPDPQDPAVLIDEFSGSRWSANTGEAIAGPMEGKKLTRVISTPAFEFGWFAYFPQSDMYAPDS